MVKANIYISYDFVFDGLVTFEAREICLRKVFV